MALLRRYLRDEVARLADSGVRLAVIGRRDRLPEGLACDIEHAERATAHGTRLSLNIALDETPGFDAVSNKDKQGFNNVMIGFGGILLAGYSDSKQNKNAESLAAYKKLAGMLIEMVLKTSPDNLRLENGQIIIK